MIQIPEYSYCSSYNDRPGIFKFLEEKEFNELRENRLIIKFNAGEKIIKQGSRALQAFLIQSGVASYYVEDNDRNRLIIKYMKRNDFCGISGIYTDNIYTFSVSAVEDCWTCFFDYDILEKIIEKNFKFAGTIIKYLSVEKAFYHSKFLCLTQKQTQGRAANAILYLKDNIYNNRDIIIAGRNDIADLTGMNKDSSGRILKDFDKEKYIEYTGAEIKILNRKKLEEIKNYG